MRKRGRRVGYKRKLKSNKKRLKTAVSERVSREAMCPFFCDSLLIFWIFDNLIENMIKKKKLKVNIHDILIHILCYDLYFEL
jgi:hypothetical protein